MIFKQQFKGRNLQKNSETYFPASVPGNIQYDYAKYFGLDDVQFSDNYKQYVPLEDDSWEYSAKLDYEKKDGERVFFVSGGIQYKYSILLNSELIYEYEGMYRPVDLDLTDRLTGDDTLTVHIYPHPKREGAPVGTRDEADGSCNPPVCYGWDWNPRLLISGMWQDAYIETRNEYYISSPQVLASLSEDLSTGSVSISYDCQTPCEFTLFDDEGKEILHSSTKETLTLDSPKLWWCNGQGSPTLYKWEIKNEGYSVCGHIGFRTLKLVRNEGAEGPNTFPKGRYEAPITIELNGRRIFGKGSNWVNPELYWGQIDEARYDSLLTLAKDCNMNILRIWGGAGINKDAFYDLCDRYGILVWQEFMLACNNYLPRPSYMKALESEAEVIIKNLRSHPSLAFWCGGNELFNNWSGMDEQSLPLRLLNKLCYDLDRERPFLYTSPLFGMAHGGYTFFDERQNGEVYAQFAKANNTAYTEFGVPSITDVEDLKKIIPEKELFPIEPTPAWIAHHGFKAWGEERWLCLQIIEKYFGKPESLEEVVENSKFMQAEGYRAAFEEMRRQWPHCSMAINWCFDEPWITAAGNSLITYPDKPKPSYFTVKEALRPTLFSAAVEKFSWSEGETFEAALWLLNDTQEDLTGKVDVSIRLGDKEIKLLTWEASADANRNTQGPTVRAVLPAVDTDKLYLKLTAENGMSSEYSFVYKKKTNTVKIKMMNV